MRRQFDGLADGVHYPAQDELSSVPASVSLQELLEGDGFVAVRFVFGGSGQYLVDDMEKVAAKRLEASRATLSQLQEVVDEDVRVPYRSGVQRVGRTRAFGQLRFHRQLWVKCL
jgi:hypothetical protein